MSTATNNTHTRVQSREDGKQRTWDQARKLARLAGTSVKPAQMYIAHEATQRERNILTNWPGKGRTGIKLQQIVDNYTSSGYNEKYGAKSQSSKYRYPTKEINKWRTIANTMNSNIKSNGSPKQHNQKHPEHGVEKELLLGLRELAKQHGGIPKVAQALEILNKVQVSK